MLTYLQEKLIFLSNVLPQEHQFSFKSNFKELFLKANDGAILHGVHFAQENAKGIILYFHGNRFTADYWGHWGEKLSVDYNYDVVVVDYRGYGKSTGHRSFNKMLSDGLLFYEYCKKNFPEKEIIIFGRSLGGAFASFTALYNNPNKLILESTFTNIGVVANNKFWGLPVSKVLNYPFQSENNVQNISVDTYFIHGDNDELVMYELGQKLFELSASKKKKLFTVEGAGHNDLQEYSSYFKFLDTIFS